jgi:short-subunit dehydrogenase
VKNEILRSNHHRNCGDPFHKFLAVGNEGIKCVCLISEASDDSLTNMTKLFDQIQPILGNGSIRILINNVGMGQNGKRRLGEIKVGMGEEGGLFEEIVKVNCIYPVLLTRAYLQRVGSASGRCLIINIASCAALTPSTPFSSLYAASKAFNRSFSVSLAGEMRAKRLLHPETTPEVDVVCVSPGFVVSNMTKMQESLYCCSAEQHAHIVFSKISNSWPLAAVDIIPHWKHGVMWSVLAFMEILVPYEWFLVGVLMPLILKFSGKYRNFKVD